MIIGEGMVQTLPEAPHLLLFPFSERRITVYDLRLRAPVKPLPAAALSGVCFTVDQPDLGERLPSALT